MAAQTLDSISKAETTDTARATSAPHQGSEGLSSGSVKQHQLKIFVAGASGTLGLPLIRTLCALGYEVTGMVRASASVDRLCEVGATPAYADAFDAEQVTAAVCDAAPDIVIDQLSCLPSDPADLMKSMPNDTDLHRKGGANLLSAARQAGVRRYMVQSRAFYLEAGHGMLADETAKLRTSAPGEIGKSCQVMQAYEDAILSTAGMEGVILRYGFFYGEGTWYHPEGAAAIHMRNKATAIIGDGAGVWSFVHLEDAISATVAALDAAPGIYNVVDDYPLPVAIWRQAFARWVSATAPVRLSVDEGLRLQGEAGVFYDTQLTGASNTLAKARLGFAPRRLLWLDA